jgi:hypothetical protein
VTRLFAWVLCLVSVALAAASDAETARRKIEQIESGKLKPGTRVELSAAEVVAYVAPDMPEGVRNPRLELLGPGLVRGSAMVDFGKVRRAQGYEPGWLLSKLLDGERPVSVTARIASGNGQITVNVEKVEVAALLIDGATLDFLIRNFLLPAYPDAAIGQPFDLAHNIDRIDVQPRGVGIVIGR